ncbi:MAG: outer membrane beta-barrel protein [Bacteroidales bacterium]|nr:outer membrane beta-barrel protein [Bacteroidales bacterium]
MKCIYRTIATFLTVALLAVFTLSASAQDKAETAAKTHNFSPYWFLSGNVGTSNLWGDIQDNSFLEKYQSEYRISTGLMLGRQFSPIFGLRLNGQYGRLHSVKESNQTVSDAWNVIEGNLNATVSLLNIIKMNPDRKFDIYAVAGLGLTNWNGDTYYRKDLVKAGNIPTQDEVNAAAQNYEADYKETALSIPVGLGVKYNVTEKFNIGLENIWKPVTSDLLDGVEGGFEYDIYSSTYLNLTYNFVDGGSVKNMIKKQNLVDYRSDKDVLERHGDKVEVKLNANYPPKYFSKKAAVKFVPVLKYNGKTKELKSITLRGENVLGDGKVINNKLGGGFEYSDVIDWEDGMEAAELVVYPVIYAPKKNPADNDMTAEALALNYKGLTANEVMLADATIITPQRVAFLPMGVNAADDLCDNASMLPSEYEKVTVVSESSVIYFKVNRHDLDWRLPLNKDEAVKAQLQKMKEFVEQGWEIKNIEINAWASPEGEESFNEGLSQRRADVGEKYLVKYFKKLNRKKESLVKIANPKEDLTWNVNARGEDWNGFLTAVQNSELNDKNIILNVVKSQPDLATREQEIRNMTLVYKEIEDDILPSLRRVEMTVNCFEPKKTEAEIAELAISDPSKLDHKEILYAAELTTDDDRRLEIYNNAMQQFPKCYKAMNNAAFILLKKGEVAKANELLEKAVELNAQNGAIYNNMGLVAAINKDYANAEINFAKAAKLGVNTNYNMGVIMITRGEYAQALTKMANKACDYNVALTHIAKNDVEKAKKVLECAPKTAANYYLQAVVGARMNNTAYMFENLVNAINADASYKGIAAQDREFIKFFNTPDFQNATK